MLELAILGLLKEQELHGYELKKRLTDTVGSGAGSGVSFGSLYPALGRLERSGAVSVVPAAAAPYGSHGGSGRGKKVYAITAGGERLFGELLAADVGSTEDERAFNLRLAFARHLSPEARLGMLERRRAYLMERLARTRLAIRHGFDRFDAYSRSLMEHGNETTERDISWLERLIAREREAAASAGSSGAFAVATGGPVAGGGPGSMAGGGPADEGGPGSVAGGGSGSAAEAAALPLSAWAEFAPPTMPVRPKSGPLVPSSNHSSGGTNS